MRLATSPGGSVLWIEWQLMHDTWFFAWLLVMRPKLVGWLRWHWRQILSACAGFSFAGCRMSAAFIDSACLLPGPWQDSQALFSQPRFLSVSTTACGFFSNAWNMSSWQPWQVVDPT